MATWRKLSVADIDGLARISDIAHPGLPERNVVFEERLKLFPEGCLALVHDDKICGYAISHPICLGQPPALDSMLGRVSPDADQYYIHDVAILPEFRGRGLTAECVKNLLKVAKSCSTTCLISVYGTASFWSRFEFTPETVDAVLAEKFADYGPDAVFLSRRNDL